MSRRFIRQWQLRINDGFDQRTWNDIDLKFKYFKTNDTTPNELDLEIYNLSEDSRRFIYAQNLPVELDAGHIDNVGLVFKGGTELINHDELDDGWLSKLHIKDGGAAARNLTIVEAFDKDDDERRVIERLLKNFQNVPPGVEARLAELNAIAQGKIDLSSFKPKETVKKKNKREKQKKDKPVEEQQREYLKKKQAGRTKSEAKKLKKAEILRGATQQKLQEFCNALGLVANITDQAINIYPAGVAISDEIIELDRSSGLIGSPRDIDGGGKQFTALLSHEYNPGMLVAVQAKYASGLWLVQRLEGSGDTRGQDWYADLYCTPYNE